MYYEVKIRQRNMPDVVRRFRARDEAIALLHDIIILQSGITAMSLIDEKGAHILDNGGNELFLVPARHLDDSVKNRLKI